jgi:Tfp pilus assembly protein PilX
MLLVVFSLLAISAAEISLLQIKMSHQMLQQERLRQTALLCLQQAETRLAHDKYSQMNPTEVTSDAQYQDQKWWHQKAESISAHEQFVIEKIATVLCLRIQGSAHAGVDFYRVTARANENQYDEGIIVQSTIARMAKASTICKELQKIREIQSARQSWREIKQFS